MRYAPRAAAPQAVPGAEADPLAASGPLPAELARPLRELYAAPADDAPYWDGLEARIMAAVRGSAATTGTVAGAVSGAMRAVPAAAAEWWQALARWTRPALAAAAVTLVVAGGALVQTRATLQASRAHTAYRAVLGDPYDTSALPLPAPDPELARAIDAYEAEPGDTAGAAAARAARVASELLSGGLVRRVPGAPAEVDAGAGRPEDGQAAERRLRREATFRSVIPAP